MPKTLKFQLERKFCSEANFNRYRISLLKYSNDNSKLGPCRVCDSEVHHSMRIQYGKCNNAKCYENGEACAWRSKTLTCLLYNDPQTRKVEFYVCDGHNALESESDETNQRGITPAVKALIEEIIPNYDNKPFNIYTRLHQQEWLRQVDKMPDLIQIQTFIANRRKSVGDTGNLEQIKQYCNQLKYESAKTNFDELFIFGERFGIGTDDNPFYLGFTTPQLIKNLIIFGNDKGSFQIDCTHKVILINYN
jgi:hypothetical protein